MATIPDVLAATDDGELDLGFVAIENSIEGTVNVTLDTLAFEHDLLIQREVVTRHPAQPAGAAGRGARRHHARAVVPGRHRRSAARGWPTQPARRAEVVAANSTAEAARDRRRGARRRLGRGRAVAGRQDLRPRGAGQRHRGPPREHHPLRRSWRGTAIPPATGHDKTSIVVFQRTDRPGSLLGILQEFAARAINLTKLECRPTKKGLGDYCFIIDLEGHVADELVADCLRDLRSRSRTSSSSAPTPPPASTAPPSAATPRRRGAVADAWIKDQKAKLVTAVTSSPERWPSGRRQRP